MASSRVVYHERYTPTPQSRSFLSSLPKKPRFQRSRSRSRSRSREKSSIKLRGRVREDFPKLYHGKKLSITKPIKSPIKFEKENEKMYNPKNYSYSSSGSRYYSTKEDGKINHNNYKTYTNGEKYQKDSPKKIYTRTYLNNKGENPSNEIKNLESKPELTQKKSRFSFEPPSQPQTISDDIFKQNELPIYVKTNFNQNIIINSSPLTKTPSSSLSEERCQEEVQASLLNSQWNQPSSPGFLEPNSFEEFQPIVHKMSSPSVRNQEINLMEIEDSEFELESESENENEESISTKIKGKNIKISKVLSLDLNFNSKNQDPRKKLCQKLQTQEKLNLILDLDETLLNSAAIPSNKSIKHFKDIPEELMEILGPLDAERNILCVLRPYYKTFLRRLSKIYNIFAYSHGRWDYVQKLLDIIDKDAKYFNRNIIFKNMGQVNKKTQKTLSNLGFSQEEINKTIIIDDQKFIWEGDTHKQVLASKKFIPLKDYIPEEKYSRYQFISADKHTLSLKDPFGAKVYSEFTFIKDTPSQLEHLCSFLEDIYDDYNLKRLSNPQQINSLNIGTLIETKYKKIINNCKISVASSSTPRTKMFQDLGILLGGAIVEDHKAEFLIIDSHLDENSTNQIKELILKNPSLKLVSSNWLTECFFSGSQLSSNDFHVKNFC